MKTYIVEDESLARDRMTELIDNSIHDIEVIGSADTGKASIQEINKLKPELVFLDIQLLDMTGFQVLEHLIYKPLVIFTTAYHSYAIEAFDHLAVDYLLKPIAQEKFDQSLKKLFSLMDRSTTKDFSNLGQLINQKKAKRTTISIKKNDKIILVDLDVIAYAASEDKYVQIVLQNNKKYLITKSLSNLISEFPDNFLRVHRSYIINCIKVYEIHKHFKGRYVFKLSDNDRTSITSSESYLSDIKRKFDL